MATEHARAILGLNVTPFTRAIGKAENRLRSFGRGIGKTLGAFGLGLGFASVTRSITDFADKLIDTSRKLGISTEFLQAWNHAAQLNGVSVNASNMALQRFSRRVAEAANGQGELKKTIEELGIPLRDNAGNMRATTDILNDYADAIKGAESQQERLRLAFKAFDSEGVGMVNVLQDGSEGLRQMTADALRLGIATEQKALISINRFSNAIAGLSIQARGWFAEAVGNFIRGTEYAIDFYKAFFGQNLGVSRSLDDAEKRELARNKAREILANREKDITAQKAEQLRIEQEKEASIREQIRLQKSDESASKRGETPSFRDQAREQIAINREREARARRLLFAARNFSIREDDLRHAARVNEALGEDPTHNLARAEEMRRRAQRAAASADIVRRGIMNPFQNLPQLQDQQRRLARAQELEADAERARRFGFVDRAQEFRSMAQAIREEIGAQTMQGDIKELVSQVKKMAGVMRELNE